MRVCDTLYWTKVTITSADESLHRELSYRYVRLTGLLLEVVSTTLTPEQETGTIILMAARVREIDDRKMIVDASWWHTSLTGAKTADDTHVRVLCRDPRTLQVRTDH